MQSYTTSVENHGLTRPSLDDLPVQDPNDLGYVGPMPALVESFESACRNGPLSTVQFIVSSEIRTPVFLHNGLVLALGAANIEVARYLLSAGAPIIRVTPSKVLSAPPDQQIPLFELLTHHGWDPSTPSYDGTGLLLPRIVTNTPLLSWFLSHGVNPNFGVQRSGGDGTLDTHSCAALESAAGGGNIEAVRMLLDAGAEISNGMPLHYAAGACPPGLNPHAGRVTPSKEFDVNMIPVMALLVERGADVNRAEESRHMVPRYAIVHAVMAGAVERVKWLLEAGADPDARGAWGSAVECARVGSDEMKKTVEEGVARRLQHTA